MFTGIYWPGSSPGGSYSWLRGDRTTIANNNHWTEGPSHCVRLIVFEVPAEGDTALQASDD